jgi:hypothetical protein
MQKVTITTEHDEWIHNMPGSKNWKMETERSNKMSSFTECDIRKIKVNLWQWTCNLHLYEYKKNYGTWIMRTGIGRDKKCFQVSNRGNVSFINSHYFLT